MELNRILEGNCLDHLRSMPDETLDCCVTSPPYWSLRDYGHSDQLGLEDTPDEYASALADVFDEVRRVLKPNGTLWVNLGDSYLSAKSDYMPTQTIANGNNRDGITKESGLGYPPNRPSIRGLKQKDLVGIPWLVAFELRRRGWWLRQDIIWAKPNPMPESVKDRCTKSHEYIFLLSKSQQYYFDYESIQEPAQIQETLSSPAIFGNRGGELNGLHSGNEWQPNKKGRDRSLPRNRNGITGSLDHKNVQRNNPNTFHLNRLDGTPDEDYYVRNKRDVWTVNLKPFRESHFATFPEQLIVPMILAGCPPSGVVYDPFFGAGTVGLVAHKLGRHWLGSELNPEYIKIANKRLEPYLAQSSLF